MTTEGLREAETGGKTRPETAVLLLDRGKPQSYNKKQRQPLYFVDREENEYEIFAWH
jgi:hypothetical protein